MKTIKNYIKAQEAFNKKDAIQFLKTHSFLFNFNKNYPFTNFDNTLGVIYIVRDPRNDCYIFIQIQKFNIENSADFMIKGTGDGLVWTNNWAVNYHSWKLFKEYEKYLLIKYEDLITNQI